MPRSRRRRMAHVLRPRCRPCRCLLRRLLLPCQRRQSPRRPSSPLLQASIKRRLLRRYRPRRLSQQRRPRRRSPSARRSPLECSNPRSHTAEPRRHHNCISHLPLPLPPLPVAATIISSISRRCRRLRCLHHLQPAPAVRHRLRLRPSHLARCRPWIRTWRALLLQAAQRLTNKVRLVHL